MKRSIENGKPVTIMAKDGKSNISKVLVRVQPKNSKNILLIRKLYTLNTMVNRATILLIWLLIRNERMIEKIG